MSENLTGIEYGRLVVLAKDSANPIKRMWSCLCSCGTKKSVRADHLKSGRTVSCGCHKTEACKKRATTHGKSKTRIYRIWRDMINRCHYEKYKEWHLYGGRGIKVCDRWKESFEAFFADMGEPENHLSIDRINTNGNYEPGNCKWSTAKEQAQNRRKPSKMFHANPNELRRAA